MAEQIGTIKITGAVGNICFYKMEEKYYARQKSSLSGKRVKKDPAFCGTMKYARLLAEASVIGSFVYRQLPKEKKGRKVYQALTGKVMKMLKEGLSRDTIIENLKAVNV